jgi:hypothetical protein
MGTCTMLSDTGRQPSTDLGGGGAGELEGDAEKGMEEAEGAAGMERLVRRAQVFATEEERDANRKKLFGALCLLEMMANFDAGVIPATVTHLMTEFELDYTEGGLLGALVYLGLTCGAPLAGALLTNVRRSANAALY